jgi:hypothetical protein
MRLREQHFGTIARTLPLSIPHNDEDDRPHRQSLAGNRAQDDRGMKPRYFLLLSALLQIMKTPTDAAS